MSTTRRTVHTVAAPAAIGPYVQAVEAGPYLFASGQIALDPASGEIVAGGIGEQTRQVMANIAAILAAAGLAFDDIVKTTIFLVEMGDFAEVNAIYGECFAGAGKPARSTVAVAALPRGARVEIEAIALRR